MTYDKSADRYASTAASRQAPAVDAVKLTPAMLSDGADLAAYAKALRIWNGSSAAVTLLVTPVRTTSDLAAAAVPITVPAGAAGWEPISARRIWSTGSTGLATALAAGTVEVLLATL
jgi:hypothetical protein